MRYKVVHGDCIEIMQQMCGNDSIDAIVTDPPAGISFMGRAWDGDKGGRKQWIAWMTGVAEECLRVLKPGGHAFVWALPRTSHWTATAWEDAGFDLRDCVYHMFGSGFPKSRDIGKAIDTEAGAKRKVIGLQPWTNSKMVAGQGISGLKQAGSFAGEYGGERVNVPITVPATAEAKQWEGWGTALKPAVECWWLLRKPLSEKTVASNVLKHGTGGINIDGCRIEGKPRDPGFVNPTERGDGWGMQRPGLVGATQPQGRWPANVLLSHHEDCECVGTKRVGSGSPGISNGEFCDGVAEGYKRPNKSSFTHKEPGHIKTKGEEEVEACVCHEDCPIRILDEQSGVAGNHDQVKKQTKSESNSRGDFAGIDKEFPFYSDKGGASRFFYQAKSAKKERNFGMPEGEKNVHPTLKPLTLMRYLIRLVTPPGGIVLDPFLGSGSTVLAAMLEDVDCIGCEKDDEYYPIAQQRCDYAFDHVEDLRHIVDKTKPEKPKKKTKSKAK